MTTYARDRDLLDKIAEMTFHVDSQFNALRNLYPRTAYGQAIQRQLASLYPGKASVERLLSK